MPLVLMQNQSILKIVIELGSPKITLKKVTARFANRKVVKNALYKRKQLRPIDQTSIGLHNATIFLNENLTPKIIRLHIIAEN